MTFLIAAIEHFTRKTAAVLTHALTERCSGFSNYEIGDFLAAPGPNIHGYRLGYPESPLVEREAEEEVAEPSYIASPHDWRRVFANGGLPIDMRPTRVGDQYCGLCGANITAVSFHACPMRVPEESPKQFTLEDISRLMRERYDICASCFHMRREHEHPYTGACSAFIEPQSHAASAGRGESSSPEVSAGPTSTAPSGERDDEARYTLDEWVAWAIPAIVDVLAEHRTSGGAFVEGSAGKVNCITFTSVHKVCDNWQAWREHVAPFIAARIKADAAQADRPNRLNACGAEAGQIFAAEFYEQHKK